MRPPISLGRGRGARGGGRGGGGRGVGRGGRGGSRDEGPPETVVGVSNMFLTLVRFLHIIYGNVTLYRLGCKINSPIRVDVRLLFLVLLF